MAEIVEKIFGKLILDNEVEDGCCEETRVRLLSSIRILSSFNHNDVIKFLLSHQLSAASDYEALGSIWKVMTQDKSLASQVLQTLMKLIDLDRLYSEDKDNVSEKRVRDARHEPLSAIVALGHMFEMREMESICEGEFAHIFVPLLTACSSFLGVSTSETIKRRPSDASKASYIRFEALKSATTPFSKAKATLKSFLVCKGCSSMVTMIDKMDKDLAKDDDLTVLEDFIFNLVHGIANDFQQFLSKLCHSFEGLLSSKTFGPRVTALCFYVELVNSECQVELALKENALRNIISALESISSPEEVFMDKDERDSIKILALRGLSLFKADEFDDENRHNFSSTILSSFMDAIGEDFKSRVNECAFSGLSTLLLTKNTFAENDVHR